MAVFGKDGRELFSPTLLHPGEALADELNAREIMQKDFANAIGMRPQYLNDLIKGKRHISPAIALNIEKALGISAEFWVRLQGDYELTLVRLVHKHQVEIIA
jgi:addiction module HigA family antidote